MAATTDPPSMEMLVKRYLRLQSRARISWAKEKKDVSKTVDTKVFKKDLGGQLDRLNAIGLATKEIIEAVGQAHAASVRAKQAVTSQNTKIARIITDYKKICTDHIKSGWVTDAQKAAWQDLGSELDSVKRQVAGFVNSL
jgi:hypothetical protein